MELGRAPFFSTHRIKRHKTERMTTIAVEDVAEEPEGPRVEPAVSDVSIKELPDTGEEVSEPPSGPSSEPTIPEPAIPEAGPTVVKVRCPKMRQGTSPEDLQV